MNLSIYEDYEVDSEEAIELPDIRAMHYELINESIKEQIEDPFESKSNFVEEYFETVDKQLELNGENPEVFSNLKNDVETFCNEVINMIDAKYNLDANIEDLELEDLKNLTLSLYSFFIVKYPKNIKKFFVKYIIANKDTIADALSSYNSKSDSVSISLKEKMSDPKIALILSHLRAVIEYIDSLDLNALDLMAVFNPERYDVYIITNAINDMVIGENFTHSFFYPLVNESEDDNFDNVFLSIEYSLMKKYNKSMDKLEAAMDD